MIRGIILSEYIFQYYMFKIPVLVKITLTNINANSKFSTGGFIIIKYTLSEMYLYN